MSSVSHEFNSDYVNALRVGDPAIEAHFVEHFSPILLRALRRKVRSADQARDVRQETFLRVLAALRCGVEVRQPGRFAAYVMSVCNNIVHETYRQQRRFVSLPALETEPVVDLPSAYALILAEETRSKVGHVLSQLSASERSVLQDVFLDEQDKDDICRRLGVSRTYLRVVLFRAKNRFRKRLAGMH
jgi:RNA polymerase sigma-70 factor (ECF subfamily)